MERPVMPDGDKLFDELGSFDEVKMCLDDTRWEIEVYDALKSMLNRKPTDDEFNNYFESDSYYRLGKDIAPSVAHYIRNELGIMPSLEDNSVFEDYFLKENRKNKNLKETQFNVLENPMGIMNVRMALKDGPHTLTITTTDNVSWHSEFTLEEFDDFLKQFGHSTGAGTRAINMIGLDESTQCYIKRLNENASLEVFNGNGSLLLKSFHDLASYGIDLLYFIVDDMTVSFENKQVNGRLSDIYMMEITDADGNTDAPVKCLPSGVPYDYAEDYIGAFDIKTEAKSIKYTARGLEV